MMSGQKKPRCTFAVAVPASLKVELPRLSVRSDDALCRTLSGMDASPASVELARLLQRQAELEARVDHVSAEERAAAAAVQEASDALVSLERAAAGGEKISEAARRKAEDVLLQARTTAASPWGERRKAARLAADDARQEVALYVAEHVDALLADVGERGERAARAEDAAAEALLAAYEERQAAERETFDLLGYVRRARPGDVARSRAEQLVAEARKLIEQGGEQAPTVLVRPGEPRYTPVGAAVA